VRLLALITVVGCGVLGGGGCSNVLGIEDPTPDFGDDGGSRTLVSIKIGPDPLALPLGVTEQLAAIGTFSDGSQADITAQTEFSVTGASLTVTPEGLAKAIAQGSSTLTAKIGRISGGTLGQVGPAVADRLMLGLGDFRLAQGQRAHLHVSAVLTDGTMADVTSTAMFASDNTGVATASAAGQIDGGSQQGSATITVRSGRAQAVSLKVTVTSKQCRPVINELQTGSGTSPDDEWVEILNPCTAAIDVAGWTLVYRGANATGSTDSSLMVTLAGQLQPGDLKLFVGPAYAGANDGQWTSGTLGQNNGAIGLRMGPRDTGPLADAVAYGIVTAGHPFIETKPAAAMVNDKSAQRLPFDGHDDDNGETDFTQVTSTSPKSLNAP